MEYLDKIVDDELYAKQLVKYGFYFTKKRALKEAKRYNAAIRKGQTESLKCEVLSELDYGHTTYSILENIIKTPYLIQRATIEDRDYKQGIDSIIKLDYMGSAEYEFGAVQNSLKRIRDNKLHYAKHEFSVIGKSITVYFNSKKMYFRPVWEYKISEYLQSLVDRKYQLKEGSHFDRYIESKRTFIIGIDFWWDIENDIMFWRTDDNFSIKFKKVI